MKHTLYPTLELGTVLQIEINRLMNASREAMRVQEQKESVKALLRAYELAKQSGEKAKIQEVANALQAAHNQAWW